MSAETRQDDAVDTLAVMLEFSQMPHVTDDQIMIETLALHLGSTRDALRDVIQDARANADERDAAIARTEAAERVVAVVQRAFPLNAWPVGSTCPMCHRGDRQHNIGCQFIAIRDALDAYEARTPAAESDTGGAA